MIQIISSFEKTFKSLAREKSVIFWSVLWPALWIFLDSFVFVSNIYKQIIPYVRGTITVFMATFSVMLTGTADLAGNIARDNESGLIKKIKSMPVNPANDFLGRLLAILVFSTLSVVFIFLCGFISGARIILTLQPVLFSAFFIIATLIASSGIGLIIASSVKNINGTIMTGIGISVVSASITGLFLSYQYLPEILKKISYFYPVSGANSEIIYVLVGKSFAGYNALAIPHIIFTVVLSFAIFLLGIYMYSHFVFGSD